MCGHARFKANVVSTASRFKLIQVYWSEALSRKTLWPSGLRRWLQAPVRKGVGSNPTGVTFCARFLFFSKELGADTPVFNRPRPATPHVGGQQLWNIATRFLK